MTKQSVVWGWVAGFSVMVVSVGCAGTEPMLAGSLCTTGLAESSRFPRSLISLWPMWPPIPGSMAGLQPPIFGNSRAISSIKSVWRQETPAPTAGCDMKMTHAGMKISNGDFGALVEDLVKALDTFKGPAQEKGEFLSFLGPMKRDIVEAP